MSLFSQVTKQLNNESRGDYIDKTVFRNRNRKPKISIALLLHVETKRRQIGDDRGDIEICEAKNQVRLPERSRRGGGGGGEAAKTNFVYY